MRRNILLVIGLAAAMAAPVRAGTFAPKPVAPEYGVNTFTRGVSRTLLSRDLFSTPYATVTISNVDVYDRFPYVEARHFQIVSDPRWNRLVMGELGQGLQAFDGSGTSFGALSAPRGLAVDEQGRVYVADAGNNRVLVLQAVTDYAQIQLEPLFSIDGLHDPYGVAYSDGGTPFVPGDDFLYVAETGRNRVDAFALGATGAKQTASVGDLGSGTGHFAGPMAVAVGRTNGANTGDVYVADAHNGRIVRLRQTQGRLEWVSEAKAGADVVTSLDTDQWGDVYAAAPQEGVVRKFTPALEPLADLKADLAQPHAIHIPFANVRDHRDGRVSRVGQPDAVSIDQWSDAGGVRLWSLGVGIDGLAVAGGDQPAAHFTLTDPASVSLEILDAADGHSLTTRPLGALDAGAHDVSLTAEDLRWISGPTDLVLRLTATSGYANVPVEAAQASFHANGAGNVALPSQALLLGNWPNPGRSFTRITFVLPQNMGDRTTLTIFDATGRRLRTYAGPFAPGLNQVVWDVTSDDGHPVRPGLYFYRLNVDKASYTHRVSVVR